MKRIIYARPDGGVSVVEPVINTYPVLEKITEEQALERAIKKLPKDAIDPRIVDVLDIPTDRTFREAWKAVDGQVVHDMDKCREIQKNRLRDLRLPLLQNLDIQFMRAVEAGNTALQAEIAGEKQALRDVTADPRLEAVTTPEELKLVIPDALQSALSGEAVNGR